MDAKTYDRLLAIVGGALAIAGLILLLISLFGETKDNWTLVNALADIFLANLFNLIRLQRKHREGQPGSTEKES